VRRLAKRKWASSTEYGVAEREEGGERGGRDGGARQVGAGLVSVRLLVGEHPQLQARQEGGE